MPLDKRLQDRIVQIVGARGCITEPREMAPYLHEDRGIFVGNAAIVVRPTSTTEVASIVKLCAEYGQSIVPQGGNTGLCGGAIPFEHGDELILTLERLNRIREIDPVNYTLIAEAGCILANIQKTADETGCLFPLSLAAEGTCQIGGNLATNAGGSNVLRYGNARDLVLGLEVVLPDGSIWNGLKALKKDNTGYALKHVFIGAEGSLGIITAAVLKLFPKPTEVQTALCALDNLDNVTRLLSVARSITGDSITGFELISRFALEVCVKHISGVSDPFDIPHPWYTLIELSTARPNANLRDCIENLLERCMENKVIVDAVVAENLEQTASLWRIRDSLSGAQKHEGASIKHDISVPVSKVPEFIKIAQKEVRKAFPGVRPCPFGHLGDGNIHFNVSQPPDDDTTIFLAKRREINRIVHDIVHAMGGSICAEHGVGRLKVNEIRTYKDDIELELMRRIKGAIDPDNIMNPGKVLS